MAEKKRVSKLFLVWQDEKEETWLREMSKQGWSLENYRVFYYTFSKIEPTDYIYKIDYKAASNRDLGEYLDIFKDAGWEHITHYLGWHYFRAKAEDTMLPDIYSENFYKAAKYKALLKTIVAILFLNIFLGVTVVPNNELTILNISTSPLSLF